MSDDKLFNLPFLHRKQLSFDHGAVFEIEIASYASVVGTILIIGATREGIFKFSFQHTGDNTERTQTYRIPDIPFFLTVYTSDAAVERGEFWCSVFLRINGERIQKLCAGYISRQSGLNYPNNQTESEFSGGGKWASVGSADPAAGSEISYSLTANYRLQIHACVFTLVTDATVANRRVHLRMTPDTSGAVIESFADIDQAASLTRKYTFANFGTLPTRSDDDDILCPLPAGIQLAQGGTVTTSTTNLQAGDNFGALLLVGDRYFEGQ